MSLLATADALIIDLRNCLGGEPSMAAFLISYLWDCDPAQLSGLRERQDNLLRQMWTLPYVPGRRFGKDKPVYVLTSAVTFSGGEQLSYDLQQLGRATIVGEPTRGGANPREGFRVHPHLEATISVATAVSPRTGGNWEGTGVAPDIQTTADRARDTAYQRALQDVITAGGTAAAEARDALAAALPATALGGGHSSGVSWPWIGRRRAGCAGGTRLSGPGGDPARPAGALRRQAPPDGGG
jgi:C-terminal processing protease CtpA/Prc